MMKIDIKDTQLNAIIAQALKEDIADGDITTDILISSHQISSAAIFAKEGAVLCGIEIVKKVFQALDKNIRVKALYQDGRRIKSGAKIISITGKTKAILTGERVALNFLSHLSGIATLTAQFVQEIHPFIMRILDTRKTTPGLRALEKYAVKCGGGQNHRANLSEWVLIKDNHIAACRKQIPLTALVKRAKRKTSKPVEVEVTNLKEFRQVLEASPDIILFDNMKSADIKKAAAFLHTLKTTKKPLLEVSGGITLKNVRTFARSGADRISVGALTHSPKAIDFSLEVLP